jgi:hypothetical protein
MAFFVAEAVCSDGKSWLFLRNFPRFAQDAVVLYEGAEEMRALRG